MVGYLQSQLPYFFDVLDYRAIEDEALKTHLDRHGIVIYQKNAEHHAEFMTAEMVGEKDN